MESEFIKFIPDKNNNFDSENLEIFEGIIKINPITIVIDNEDMTLERKAYVDNFKFLKFRTGFNKNIDFLSNDTSSIEMLSYQQPFYTLPINLKRLKLKDYNFGIAMGLLPKGLEEFVFHNASVNYNGKIMASANTATNRPTISFNNLPNLRKIKLLFDSNGKKQKIVFPQNTQYLEYNHHFYNNTELYGTKNLIIPENLIELCCNGSQDIIIKNNKLRKIRINVPSHETFDDDNNNNNAPPVQQQGFNNFVQQGFNQMPMQMPVPILNKHKFEVDLSLCPNLSYLILDNNSERVIYDKIKLPDSLRALFVKSLKININKLLIHNLMSFKCFVKESDTKLVDKIHFPNKLIKLDINYDVSFSYPGPGLDQDPVVVTKHNKCTYYPSSLIDLKNCDMKTLTSQILPNKLLILNIDKRTYNRTTHNKIVKMPRYVYISNLANLVDMKVRNICFINKVIYSKNLIKNIVCKVKKMEEDDIKEAIKIYKEDNYKSNKTNISYDSNDAFLQSRDDDGSFNENMMKSLGHNDNDDGFSVFDKEKSDHDVNDDLISTKSYTKEYVKYVASVLVYCSRKEHYEVPLLIRSREHVNITDNIKEIVADLLGNTQIIKSCDDADEYTKIVSNDRYIINFSKYYEGKELTIDENKYLCDNFDILNSTLRYQNTIEYNHIMNKMIEYSTDELILFDEQNKLMSILNKF